MSELRTLNDPELEALLTRAKECRSLASLRADNSVRMLGQLSIQALEPGVAIHLQGAKRRDDPPPAGTAVTLSLVLGDEVVAIRTRMLDRVKSSRKAPLFRTGWPTLPLEFHKRDDVRVANPVLPPLDAVLVHQGRTYEAKLLNLTETGMGLGLPLGARFDSQDQVEVETRLPDGTPFRAAGQVRHWEVLEGEDMPTRLGVVLADLSEGTRKTLRSLIQARRMYLSQDLRDGC
jgi:c-di-GMP-binding flagellar brake protein YcgR